VVFRDIELIVIDSHDDSDVFVLTRSGDDDFLGTCAEVALGFFTLGEESGRLDNDIDIEILPRERGRTFLHCEALDLVTIDHQRVVLGKHGRGFFAVYLSLKDALRGVVFDKVGKVVGGYEVIDGDDIVPLLKEALFGDGTEDKAADAAEPIDGNIRHSGGILVAGVSGRAEFLIIKR